MKIEDVKLGEIYYIKNPNYGIRGAKVLKGVVIEINRIHKTVLLKGDTPSTECNFGARLEELFHFKSTATMSAMLQ